MMLNWIKHMVNKELNFVKVYMHYTLSSSMPISDQLTICLENTKDWL